MNPSQPKNQKPLIKTEIPGPKSLSFREREDHLLAPGLQNFAILAGITVEEAKGSLIRDVDGNDFLDWIGGIGVNGLGHSHPRWVSAIKKQVEIASVGSFTSKPRVDLFEKLAKHPPAPGVNRTQLYSSGAEAVESALRLAKSATGKNEFASFTGAFHGKTMGVLTLMGSDFKKGMGPFVPGAHSLPYPDCYRCPMGLTNSSCGMACVEESEKILKKSCDGKLAAIIVEPMQGTAGNIIPPIDFLPAMKEVAKRQNALLIADEMITGFGRTGKYWGVEHSGVVPDIVTLGKQFGGGFPVSAVLSREDIVKSKPWSNPSGSSSSYGGNPLASAAVSETLSIIDDEKLVENSRVEGAWLLGELKKLQERFPFMGDVRGLGLFLGIELVKDRKTKEPISKETSTGIFKKCLKRGLLTMSYSPSFRIQPAMTIDRQTLANSVAVLEEVFVEVMEEGSWRH